jgi:histidinol phosphatase-like PHP family hydrolase
MIDLHTHTVFSDGELIPAELARRARVTGYQALAITDHVDHTTMGWVLTNLLPGVKAMRAFVGLDLLVGVELTHVPPGLISDLTVQAREMGADIVIVHGQTLVEPVEEGTNLAAIEAGVDVLAHPGLITAEEAALAAERGVALEISTRKGHSLANGHVTVLARAAGARLVINNDAHAPGDLIPAEQRRLIATGAGLTDAECLRAEQVSREIVQHVLTRRR